MGMTSIAIIGAGYAGLLAANRAASRGHTVTLVNERDTFIDRIRLHEYIAGTRPKHRTARPLRPLLHRKAKLVLGRAAAYGPGAVELESGATIPAEHILITTGSAAQSGGWAWAEQARDDLAGLPAGASVTIAGAGLTGIEVAAEVAAVRPELNVVLADPRPALPDGSEEARASLARALAKLRVRTTKDTESNAELTIDCTGFRHDRLTGGKALDVDEFLRVPGMDRVWAAGDAARVLGQPHLRMACASAEPMAAHAVDQIHRQARGQGLRPVSIGFAGRCLSLGRRDAVIQFVRRDDSPTERVWTGRPAVCAKEFLCRFALLAPVRLAPWYRELEGPSYA